MKIAEMIAKYGIELATQNGAEGLRAYGVKTAKQKSELVAAKPEIMAELKKRAAKVEAKKAAEEAAKAKHIAGIKAGAEKVTVKWNDGEYLQGYEAFGEEAELLAEIGLAKWVSGWGYLVSDQAIEALGESFTYQQAIDYMKPENDAKAVKKAKATAERAAKFQQAKETGKPVELSSYSDECDGSVSECSLDIVTIYAMPDGTTKTTRTHTF